MKGDNSQDVNIIYKILGHDWEIAFIDNNDERLNPKVTRIICYGLCDSECRCIYLADNIKESIVEDTLIHELTHAYIGATMHHEADIEFEEEFICDFFANFGEQILVDSAALLKIRAGKKEKNKNENESN